MSGSGLAGDSRAEWKAHWPVVLAACSGVAASTINTYSTGVFMQPLQEEFGWSRAGIVSGSTMAGVATILLAPFCGALVDRVGPRRIGIVGVALSCGLTALLSTVGPSLLSWQGVWMCLALINVMILPNVWTAAVSSVFAAGRGLALAITLCGSGISSIITPILTVHLIDMLGWRHAYIALAGLCGLLVLPLLFMCFRSARDTPSYTPSTTQRQSADLADARTILISRHFLQLALATILIASVIVPIGTMLVPILSSRGLERGTAAGIAALMGIASISGRLLIGHLLDRVNARLIAAVAVCLPIIACLLLISFPGAPIAATLAVLCAGLALGAELDIVAYLASRYFSLERFGLAFGTLAGIVTLGGMGLGPLALSTIFDQMHSYVPALWAGVPMCMASSILFWRLGPYPEEEGLKG